jgi:hypothetical protein
MTYHQGKLLSGEGYREPFGMVNLALEHKFSPRLSLNIRANDVLRSTDQKFRVDTDVLRDYTATTVHQRRMYVGLRYSFGGVTGSDAVRNALQAAGVPLDSQAAREALRMAQGQQAGQGTQGQAGAAAGQGTVPPQAPPAPAQAAPATSVPSAAPVAPQQPAPQQ